MKFEITNSGKLYCLRGDVTRRWITRDEVVGTLCRVLRNPEPDTIAVEHHPVHVGEEFLLALERNSNGYWLVSRAGKFCELSSDEALASVVTFLYTGEAFFPLLTYAEHKRRFFWLDKPVLALIGGPL